MSSPSSPETTITVVADAFGRDLEAAYASIARIVAEARARGTDLLVLPEACLGGYLPSLGSVDDDEETRARRRRNMPPAFRVDGPEVARVVALAGGMTVLFGMCEGTLEGGEEVRYNTAVAVTGDGVLAAHRKVHQPLGENLSYSAAAA